MLVVDTQRCRRLYSYRRVDDKSLYAPCEHWLGTCASGLHREIVTRHWPRSQTESYPSEQFNLVVSRLVANNISVLLYPLSHFRDCKALLVTSLTHVCGAITSVQTFTFIFICLLSRRSRQRERLYATGVSICSSVCLSVCLSPNCKNAIFSKPKQFRAVVSIDDQ